MAPQLIYHAVIHDDDTIETLVFESRRGTVFQEAIDSLEHFATSYKNLTHEKIQLLSALKHATGISGGRRQMLSALEAMRRKDQWDDYTLSFELAEILYRPEIADQQTWVPSALRWPHSEWINQLRSRFD